MAVFVDIPGVGTVEAKNAATEATLKEILKALKGSSGGGGAAGGTTGSAASAGAKSPAAQMMAGAAKSVGSGFGMVGKMAQGLAGGLKGLTSGVGLVATGAIAVAKGFGTLMTAATNLIDELAGVGNSLTAAASALSNIPIVGGFLATVLGAVAKASEEVAGSFQSAASSGATFGGSINQFSAAASQAGMTMRDFAAILRSNGEGMLGFGTTTEDGAKRFASVSRQLRATGTDLYNLGYNTKEINEGLANYGKLVRMQGRAGQQSNEQLAAGAKNYLKEMDALAKITGQERAAKEKEREALVADGMFRAAMAGLGPEVEESALQLIQSMPTKELQDFAKDLIANGTATTQNSKALMAQFPGLASQFQAMHKQTQQNVAISKQQINQALNTGRKEGPANLQRIKSAAAADESLHGVAASMAAFGRVQEDAVLKAGEQQDASKKTTDGLNAAIEQNKAALAGLSNSFQMFLANSGLLNILMSAFEGLANFTTTFLMPAFNLMAAVIQKVWVGMEILLAPVIEMITNMLGEGGLGGALMFVDQVINAVFPILDATIRGAIMAFEGLWNGVMALVSPISNLFTMFGDLGVTTAGLTDIILRAGDFIGGVFEFLGTIVGGLIEGFIGLVRWVVDTASQFEFVQNAASTLKSVFVETYEFLRTLFSADGAKTLMDAMAAGAKGMFGGLLLAVEKIVPDALGGAKLREAGQALVDSAKQNRNAAKVHWENAQTEVEARETKVDNNKKEIQLNSQRFQQQRLHMNKMGGLQKEAEQAKQGEVVDYNDSLAILKSEMNRNNTPVSTADSARNQMVSDAEKKAADAKAAADAANAPSSGNKGTNQSTPPSRPQESAETLLAQLNSKMDQLIKINKDVHNVNERQLTIQQSMTGDLFVAP
jgi:hypothetical protein